MTASRRGFLAGSLSLCALAGTCVPSSAQAQSRERIRRLGFISMRSGPGEFDAAFRDALRALGYVDGRSIEIEYAWAAESDKRAEELAARLVSRNVDVIVAATTVAIGAAMRATSRIPIVMAAAADPVASGLVANLSRPGGNVTGLTLLSTDTGAKRLQLLREVVPGVSRVAVLLVERGSPDDRAVNAQLNSLVIDNRARLVELAARHRLPAIYEVEGFVAAGGLLSYGPSIADWYRRAAGYVDRILKGANPAELPLEQPTVFRSPSTPGRRRRSG